MAHKLLHGASDMLSNVFRLTFLVESFRSMSESGCLGSTKVENTTSMCVKGRAKTSGALERLRNMDFSDRPMKHSVRSSAASAANQQAAGSRKERKSRNRVK